MTEEFLSVREIISRNFQYLFQDKKRLLKLLFYTVYLYLFSKRFYLVVVYFKNVFLDYFASVAKWNSGRGNKVINLDSGKSMSAL